MPSLPKAYKSFVRPNLDYGDISKCSIFPFIKHWNQYNKT